MLRKAVFLFTIFAFLISLSGCATFRRKQNDLEMQGLKNQISVLETQLQAKDEEIISLRDALGKAAEEKGVIVEKASKKRAIGEVKSRPKAKQIQIALSNAGYNPGSIDGKMGRQTREAVRAFQRANNLAVDGKVGKRTWTLLRKYLYTKVK